MRNTQAVAVQCKETVGNSRFASQDAMALPLDRQAFLRALEIEQKRTARSGRKFILAILDSSALASERASRLWVREVPRAVCNCIRDTDMIGWYKDETTLGVIFTELGTADVPTAIAALSAKLRHTLAAFLTTGQIIISFHVFPEDWDEEDGPDSNVALYEAVDSANRPSRASLIVKRSIDIAGSLAALLLLSPLFVLIAVLIKLTSKGPVLFRQQRVGQYGKRFTFLKFRSMHSRTDSGVHQMYMKRFIAGAADPQRKSQDGPAVYKIKNDPRLTPIGGFLRKSSLDELPQFLNVLKGEMSLVGPRPPIPYEIECYAIWHRRRLMVVKPGITGLWQVTGRSRVKFDDMVRLDLKYAKTWSIWLDLKILLQTPRAVFTGEGAF